MIRDVCHADFTTLCACTMLIMSCDNDVMTVIQPSLNTTDVAYVGFHNGLASLPISLTFFSPNLLSSFWSPRLIQLQRCRLPIASRQAPGCQETFWCVFTEKAHFIIKHTHTHTCRFWWVLDDSCLAPVSIPQTEWINIVLCTVNWANMSWIWRVYDGLASTLSQRLLGT